MAILAGNEAQNQAQLSKLLEAECHRLRGLLSRRIPPAHRALLDVDDILQQSCVDAFRSIENASFEDRQAFSMWFETIARRNLISSIRSLRSLRRGGDRKQIVASDAESSLSVLLSQVVVHSVTASRQALKSESLEQLRTGIDRLPTHYRKVIERYDLQQQPIEQVAQSLDKTVGATFMVRNRALRLLAEMLGSATGI